MLLQNWRDIDLDVTYQYKLHTYTPYIINYCFVALIKLMYDAH